MYIESVYDIGVSGETGNNKMNEQIEIVKSFIKDSFVPLAKILDNHNRDRNKFAAELVQEICDVTGEMVSEMSVHIAMRHLAYEDLQKMIR